MRENRRNNRYLTSVELVISHLSTGERSRTISNESNGITKGEAGAILITIISDSVSKAGTRNFTNLVTGRGRFRIESVRLVSRCYTKIAS